MGTLEIENIAQTLQQKPRREKKKERSITLEGQSQD
jgi:hypothetical protein